MPAGLEQTLSTSGSAYFSVKRAQSMRYRGYRIMRADWIKIVETLGMSDGEGGRESSRELRGRRPVSGRDHAEGGALAPIVLMSSGGASGSSGQAG